MGGVLTAASRGPVCAAWVAAIASCGSAARRPEPASSSASVDAPVPVMAEVPSALPARRSDGCWGLSLPPEPELRMRLLEERCAAGLARIWPEPRPVELAAGASAGLDVGLLPAGTCLRVAVVGLRGDAEVRVVSADGVTLATDRALGFALAPPSGPACSAAAGEIRARVENHALVAQTLLVQAWAQRP